ncbi:MAG: SDR family NAD(P)-dependent oxidoreductase, partial [Giesbergeria sp.]
MPKHLTILTGASRGMGLAMARQLLRPGHTLLCISRSPHGTLAQEASAQGCTLESWEQDLAQPEQAATRLREWLQRTAAGAYASATLIN